MRVVVALAVLTRMACSFSVEGMVSVVGEGDNECTSKLFHIMNNVTQGNLFNTIVISSGKSPNDLGNFERCISRNELEYALVTVRGESNFR